MKSFLDPQAILQVVHEVLTNLPSDPAAETFYRSAIVTDDPALEACRLAYVRQGILNAVHATIEAISSPYRATDRIQERFPDSGQWGTALVNHVEDCLKEWVSLGRSSPPNDKQLAHMLDLRGVRSLTGRPLKDQNLYRHLSAVGYVKRERFRYYLDLELAAKGQVKPTISTLMAFEQSTPDPILETAPPALTSEPDPLPDPAAKLKLTTLDSFMNRGQDLAINEAAPDAFIANNSTPKAEPASVSAIPQPRATRPIPPMPGRAKE